MTSVEQAAKDCADRPDLWRRIIEALGVTAAAEVGVWRGEFAEFVLKNCPSIQTYYMVDPWRHLDAWNKPFNVADDRFEAVLREALARTEFATDRRRILRGTTVEKAGEIPDRGLDFCYVDGDHTLRGIMIDLIRLYPKVRDGGVLGGDDFQPGAWQHDQSFEPTLIFPAAVYFAEATGSVIYGLPHGQFAILVDRARDAFEFRDLTGHYAERSVLAALQPAKGVASGGRIRRALRRLIP